MWRQWDSELRGNLWIQFLLPHLYSLGDIKGIDLDYQKQKQKFWSEADS